MFPGSRRILVLSVSAVAVLAAPAFAGTIPGATTACQAQTVQTASINSPTGLGGNTAAGMGQSMNGQAPAATSGVKGMDGSYIAGTANGSAGVRGIDGQTIAGTGTNAKGVKGIDGSYIAGTGQQQVSFNNASVGGLGANGGNGDLNMNNGGMAGAMDDTKGGSKQPDGKANSTGSWMNALNSNWGHPENGKDSHGNTWANDQLVNGYDTNGTEYRNGKPWNGPDGSGGSYKDGKHIAGFPGTPPSTSEPGADTGVSDGPGGSNATGQAVNTGNHGGNDGGNGTGQGTSGNDGTNAAGMAFNGGGSGRVGGDAGLGAPKPIEAFNGAKLNNGVTDPCAGAMVH